ncbi:MAG TPA: HlyD family secretion protein [Alphaproteobacteria bacterium]|nr:HlyD family secretion protein [Alphaproteobacteria bacterium]
MTLSTQENKTPEKEAPRLKNLNKRKDLFKGLFAVVFTGFLSYGLYWYFFSSHYISTNNAYVAADSAEICALTEGVVESVEVIDTQYVKKEDLLITLDQRDLELSLKQAHARFSKAENDLKRTEIDYKRRKALSSSGSVSAEELTNTENAFKIAQATYEEALAAKGLVELNLSRTKLYSPFDGVVSKRQVQLGQRVIPGAKLLTVVPLDQLFVNANFKETEIKHIKIGQKVKLKSDKYGFKAEYDGVVEGFSGGTGAAFAIIPAQNATGNWVKVVQRLPVRVKLLPEQLKAHPLAIGLSMDVEIDISK